MSEAPCNLELLTPRKAEEIFGHVSNDAFLTYAIRILLDHTPNTARLTFYHQLLSAGRDRRTVLQDIMNSPEFLERYGARQRRAMPIDRFICDIFQDVLARWPDEGAMKTYTAMSEKWNGRRRVQSAILRSPEARRRNNGRLGRIAGLARFAASGPLFSTSLWQRLSAVRLAARLAADPCEFFLDIVKNRCGKNTNNKTLKELDSETFATRWRESVLDPIDPATARAQDINEWAFRRAYQDARRQMLVD